MSGCLLPDDIEALRKARVGQAVLRPSLALQIAAVLVSDSALFGSEKKITAFCDRLQQGEAAEILSAKCATEAAMAVFVRAAQCWHHCSGRLPDTRLGFDAVFDLGAAQTSCHDGVDPRTVILEIDRGFAGNAADLRGYRLLGTPFRGEAGPTCLAEEIEANSEYARTLAAAFGSDLMTALRQALHSKSAAQRQARTVPNRAKVIMLPQEPSPEAPEESGYAHLTPLTSVPLAITIRDRIRHRRAANRAALERKKQEGFSDLPNYAPAPPLAYQAFGGTKPQNGGFLELQAINGQLPLLTSTSLQHGAVSKDQKTVLEKLQWQLSQGVLSSLLRPLPMSAFVRKSIAALGTIGYENPTNEKEGQAQLERQLRWVLPLAERFTAPLWALRTHLSALETAEKASLRRAMRACVEAVEDPESPTYQPQKASLMHGAELDFLTTDAYDTGPITAAQTRLLTAEAAEILYNALAAFLKSWAESQNSDRRPFLSFLVVKEAVRRQLEPTLEPQEIVSDRQYLKIGGAS